MNVASISATKRCGFGGTGSAQCSPPRSEENGFRNTASLLINVLQPREGSTAVAFPPPLIPENLFSVCGPSQIFLLFSKVIADELLSAGLVFYPKMVLSTPNFSKAVD